VLEVARKISVFCKMARRSNLVGPRWPKASFVFITKNIFSTWTTCLVSDISNTVLKFVVKFFPPDPGQVREEYTRYLFALQIKQDIVGGLLPCNNTTLISMASCIAQGENLRQQTCLFPLICFTAHICRHIACNLCPTAAILLPGGDFLTHCFAKLSDACTHFRFLNHQSDMAFSVQIVGK